MNLRRTTCEGCLSPEECKVKDYCYLTTPAPATLHNDGCAILGGADAMCDCGDGRELPTLSDSRVTKFDDAIKVVTDQRGSVYGHPKHDFGRADRLKAVVAECQDPLARHALEMICVKVARLIQTPTHLDSWIDIAGYARTGVMVTDDR